jgi:hypothetical protein
LQDLFEFHGQNGCFLGKVQVVFVFLSSVFIF